MTDITPQIGQWVEAKDGDKTGLVIGFSCAKEIARVEWLGMDGSSGEQLIEEPDFPFSAIGGIIVNKGTITRLQQRRQKILKRQARKEVA